MIAFWIVLGVIAAITIWVCYEATIFNHGFCIQCQKTEYPSNTKLKRIRKITGEWTYGFKCPRCHGTYGPFFFVGRNQY